MINLTTKPPTPYHIGDVVKIALRAEWYDPVFENDEKMSKSTAFSAPFKHLLFPPDTKILRP